jgi:hypothetical protein
MLPLLLAALWIPQFSSAEIDPADTKGFEIFGIKINSDSYSVVVDKLGPTKLIRPKSTGAGFNGDATFCYTGKQGTRLTFLQGFSENYTHVTGYALEVRSSKPNKNCKAITTLSRSLRTPNGLGLGLPKSEVEKILGAPKGSTKTSAKFSFEKQLEYEKGSGKGNIFNLDVDVAYDKDGRVKSLEVDFGSEPL